MKQSTDSDIWLDATTATPLIGIRLIPSFSRVLEWRSLIAKFLDDKLQTEKTINYGQNPDGTNTIIGLGSSNITINLSTDNLVIQINENAMRSDTEIQPYSKSLARMLKVVEQLFDMLSQASEVIYNRIGIVSSCVLSKENLPPGIIELQKRFESQWNGKIVKIDGTITAKLEEEESYYDQCHHKLVSEQSTNQVIVVLDWQRVFNDAQNYSANQMDSFSNAVHAAMKYFELVGLGGF